MALCAKSSLGFVDWSLPTPKEKDDISNWEQSNDQVVSWIINSISHEIHPNILYAKTVAP